MRSAKGPRLLVLTQTHNVWGGIESWMADLFPAMAAAGWNVHYALASGARFNIPAAFKRRHEYIQHSHILDGRVGTPDRRQRAVLSILSRVEPDVVMPIVIGDAIPAIRQHKSRGGGARLIVPVHSSHLGALADILNNRDIIDAIGVVSGLLYQWAKEVLSSFPIEVHWVRNGVLQPSRSKVPGSSDVLRVAFVGRLDSGVKRALDLISILDSLRAAHERISLTVIGEGPCGQMLVQGLARFSDFHEVRVLGFIDRNRLYQEIYPELDCILLTSEQEGSPLVLIEAMQHGVVPVSSRFLGHAAEGLLSPGLNSLTFPVGDGAAAAASLKRLAHNRVLLAQLGEQAKRSVAMYTRDGMIDGWRQVCSGVLENKPRIPPKRRPGSDRIYGRLDRLGMPAAAIDMIRRVIGKRFDHGSGFDEWPGSLNTESGLEDQISRKLNEIEALRSVALYNGLEHCADFGACRT